VLTRPRVDAARLAAAERTAAPFVEEALRQPVPASPWAIPYALVGLLWPFAVAGLVVSLVFRSGLVRMSGLEVVTGDGEPAGRVRLLTRSLLIWSPIVLAHYAQAFAIGVQPVPGAVSLVAVAIVAAGAILAVRTPSRGLHDRITGTWVVPR
jgi:hypothetical protein